MENFVVFCPDVHRSTVVDLSERYFGWMASELQKNYEIDVYPIMGTDLRDYVESNVDEFTSSISADGVLYLIQVENEIVGMGALRRLKERIGEIKRMYIKPEYQGKGLGKSMLQLLLGKAREYGFSTIYLETGSFMATAQHLYRSVGFRNRAEYPETEVPPQLRHVWLFMEKEL
jgi:N-acetylglutamate synthase-like GNAT family acetyltransferase